MNPPAEDAVLKKPYISYIDMTVHAPTIRPSRRNMGLGTIEENTHSRFRGGPVRLHLRDYVQGAWRRLERGEGIPRPVLSLYVGLLTNQPAAWVLPLQRSPTDLGALDPRGMRDAERHCAYDFSEPQNYGH